MTEEEKKLIAECKVTVNGTASFNDYISEELYRLGFKNIHIESAEEDERVSIISIKGRHILAFDFVDGAGAIVVLPENEIELLEKQNLRQWMAEYIIGYCAFWNVEGYQWLRQSLPEIKNRDYSLSADRTGAHICARIAGNIAVDRPVKHFPLFYLCKNLE